LVQFAPEPLSSRRQEVLPVVGVLIQNWLGTITVEQELIQFSKDSVNGSVAGAETVGLAMPTVSVLL
jgi:hypothetical protein